MPVIATRTLVSILGAILGLAALAGAQTAILTSQSPASTPLTLNELPGQTADMFRVSDFSGNTLAKIGADGSMLASAFRLASNQLMPSLLFTDSSSLIKQFPQITLRSATTGVGYFIGVNAGAPRAPFHVGSDSLFSGKVAIDDGGFSSFSIGSNQIASDFGNFNFVISKAWGGFELRQVSTPNAAVNNPNEWGLMLGCHIGKLASGVAYEKACLMVDTETEDATSGGINRNAFGADIRGAIRNSTTGARAWGLGTRCTVGASSTGLCISDEADLSNGGVNQSLPDQATSTYGLFVNSIGTTSGTVAVAIESSSTGNVWHKGLWSAQNYLADSFLELFKTSATTHLFKTFPTGQTLIGDLPNDATTNNYDSSLYGQLTVLGELSIATPTTNKQFLSITADGANNKYRIAGNRYDSSVAYNPITLETGGNEAVLVTTDPFLQLTASFTGATPKSASGTVGIRNNAGTLECSQNAGAWTTCGGGGSTVIVLAGTVLTSDQATVTFNNLAQTARNMKIVASTRSTSGAADDGLQFRFNNDATAANYDTVILYTINGSAPTSGRNLSFGKCDLGSINGAGAPRATEAGVTESWIPNYIGTTYEKISTGTTGESSSAIEMLSCDWHSTAAITRLDFFAGGGSLKAGSSIWVYGYNDH